MRFARTPRRLNKPGRRFGAASERRGDNLKAPNRIRVDTTHPVCTVEMCKHIYTYICIYIYIHHMYKKTSLSLCAMVSCCTFDDNIHPLRQSGRGHSPHSAPRRGANPPTAFPARFQPPVWVCVCGREGGMCVWERELCVCGRGRDVSVGEGGMCV